MKARLNLKNGKSRIVDYDDIAYIYPSLSHGFCAISKADSFGYSIVDIVSIEILEDSKKR